MQSSSRFLLFSFILIFIFMSGCNGAFPSKDIITESRYKDQNTASLYLKTPTSYCITSSSLLLNRYKNFFEKEISNQWNRYASPIQKCDASSYKVDLNLLVHYALPLDSNSREAKLSIYDPSGKLLADFSLGELRNIDNEADHEFYHNFTLNYLNPKHIFGVSK